MSEATPGTRDIVWLKPVEIDVSARDVCLFVSHLPQAAVKRHVVSHIARLRQQGFYVILILAADDPEARPDNAACADAVTIRHNFGWDFGAWAAVLRDMPELWDARSLTLVNDSVFGPFDGFENMIGRIRTSKKYVVALVESFELKHHFQSFFMTFHAPALRSPELRAFWDQVENLQRKWDVTLQYESELYGLCESAGLSVEILFPIETLLRRSKRALRVCNPTHHLWRELLAEGFPYIKIQLLRDNPQRLNLTNWQEALKNAHADVEDIKRYLAEAGNATGYGAHNPHLSKVVKAIFRSWRHKIRDQLGIPSKRDRLRRQAP